MTAALLACNPSIRDKKPGLCLQHNLTYSTAMQLRQHNLCCCMSRHCAECALPGRLLAIMALGVCRQDHLLGVLLEVCCCGGRNGSSRCCAQVLWPGFGLCVSDICSMRLRLCLQCCAIWQAQDFLLGCSPCTLCQHLLAAFSLLGHMLRPCGGYCVSMRSGGSCGGLSAAGVRTLSMALLLWCAGIPPGYEAVNIYAAAAAGGGARL